MSSIDSYMIPITISICLIAIAPIVAPDWDQLVQETNDWDTPKIFPNAAISMNDKEYFENLDENIENTKQSVRDLMAEHEKNNP